MDDGMYIRPRRVDILVETPFTRRFQVALGAVAVHVHGDDIRGRKLLVINPGRRDQVALLNPGADVAGRADAQLIFMQGPGGRYDGLA